MFFTMNDGAGRELSYAQQYGAAALLSFPIFFLAGAGTAVFWVLGKNVDFSISVFENV